MKRLCSQKVFVLVVLLIGLVACGWAQSEKQVFQLTGGDQLNLTQLKQEFKSEVGTVPVIFGLDNGQFSEQPHVNLSMARSGSEAFAQKIVDIMSTWKFSNFGKGKILITVTVSPLKEAGLIEIDLTNFSLPNVETHGFGEANNLVQVDGFDKVLIKKYPTGFEPPAEEKSFVEKLGLPFFIAFCFLTLGLLLWIVKVSLKFAASKLSEKNMRNGDVDAIRKEWEKGIVYSSCGGDLLELEIYHKDNYAVLQQLAQAGSESDVKKLIADAKLSSIKNIFVWEETGAEKDWQEIKRIAEGMTMLYDFSINEEKFLKLPDAEQRKYNAMVWAFFSRPYVQKAYELCKAAQEKADLPIYRIYMSGLLNHMNNANNWWTSSEIDRAIENTAIVELEHLRGGLDWIWAIGSVSPMIGLFGTVVGITQAFAKIAQNTGLGQNEMIRQLAGGINQALYTTIAGLVVGMTAVLVYYFLKSKVDSIEAMVEKFFTEITNLA